MEKYYAHADSVKTDSKEFDYYVELYLADQVDARIAKLEKALREIMEMTNADNSESYRSDDREGCLDTVFAKASRSLMEPGAK